MTPKLSHTEELKKEIEKKDYRLKNFFDNQVNISWSAKEDFKKLMGWDENRFIKETIIFPNPKEDILKAELKGYTLGISDTNSKWKDAVSKLKEEIMEYQSSAIKFHLNSKANNYGKILEKIDKIFKELTSEGETK